MTKRFFKTEFGFTLLEVMIAVTILGVIMTLVWSSTSQSLKAKDRFEKRDFVYHSASLAMRKLSDDLTMAFLAKTATTETGTEEAKPQQKSDYKTFFVGEDSGENDSLKFTTFSHMRLFKNAREADQCKVSYDIENAKDAETGALLVRKEEAWINGTTEFESKGMELVEGIKSFNLEYYDPRKDDWTKNWNTESVDYKDKLPMAVKVEMVFADPSMEDGTVKASTIVMIPLYKDPVSF